MGKMRMLELVKRHEGYKPYPYIDPEVKKIIPKDELQVIEGWLPRLKLTVGYGTLLPLYKEEAEFLLKNRLLKTENELAKRLNFFYDLPETIQEILLNMAYNLGVPKLMKFKNTLAAAKAHNWQKMADEMEDSNWYRQVGDRAKELIKMVRNAYLMRE